MQASPIKLKSGDWGARVRSTNVREGDTITITTKAGKSWTATVEKVVWRGDGVSICATSSGYSRRGRGYVDSSGFEAYCGYRCPVGGFVCSPQNGPCHDCA